MAATVPAGTAVQGEREETTEKDRHTTSGRRHAVATLDELVYSRRVGCHVGDGHAVKATEHICTMKEGKKEGK